MQRGDRKKKKRVSAPADGGTNVQQSNETVK